MGIKDEYRGPTGKILPGLQLEITEALSRLKQLFASKGIIVAYLFGSHAQNAAKSSSDIDLAVLLPGDKSSSSEFYRKLITDIRETIGTERFDLLILNNASPTFQHEVISSGIVIYARSEEEQEHFEMKTRQKYLDTAYLRKVQNQYLKKRVEQWYSEAKAF